MTEPKYKVGEIVTLKSGTQHVIQRVYEYDAARGYRYGTVTVKDGKLYGPSRNITDASPTKTADADDPMDDFNYVGSRFHY